MNYFDRISVIHLRRRTDRYGPLVKELRRIGIRIDHPKVDIQDGIVPNSPDGFPSIAVYGCFLSHLEVLKRAQRDDLGSVLVLEDDAIFSNSFYQRSAKLTATLAKSEWGMCHFGHSLSSELKKSPRDLVPYDGPFLLAHCYAVHKRALSRLVGFLERTITNEPSNPEGARMYIDGAFNHFRNLNSDLEFFVVNPPLSVQRGSPSSLAGQKWYDGVGALRPLVDVLRAARDESWRQIGWPAR